MIRPLLALLLVPLLAGVLGVPAAAPSPASADELSEAQAAQKSLEAKITAQKRLISSLDSSQARLRGRIAATSRELKGITSDLAATRKQVDSLVIEIDGVQATYDQLVTELADLDAQLVTIQAQEDTKKAELGERKAQLAQRIRSAYEAERTSLLETFLSGSSFTDVLAEMSYELDAAEQDKALAEQIARDRETLASLHATVVTTRTQTNVLRQATAVQKAQLDSRLAELKAAQARLAQLEKATKASLAAQEAAYKKLAADESRLRRSLAAAAAARKKLEAKIDALIAEQFRFGNIPSEYNGTLRWPMSGSISGEYGCTSFAWYPPANGCKHYHNGIDIVAPYGTPVRASGAGRVVYVGWNYADGADPAWIVIIAHSSDLATWYAHMQPKYPVRAGDVVKAGQIIGYEGNTGRSTGAHLHWMVMFHAQFVNPRLFV